MRVARNDSGAGVGRGKVSAENWRVKEFKRREQKKKTRKNAYLIKPTPDRPPLAAVMLILLFAKIRNLYCLGICC